MPAALRLAIAGLGRIGALHARHAVELELETGHCQVTALVESDPNRAATVAGALAQLRGGSVPLFSSVERMAAARVADATLVATPTHRHREHTQALVSAGQRVLLEKPLTGTLAGDREFADELDRTAPHGVMLGFQRRFDEPLRYARQLLTDGAIGRVFKIVSILEDSNPAPDGYASGGILPDMSIHNVDEILWLLGRMPVAAASIGNCLHARKLTTADEDFDDALLYLWFEGELAAQVQVSRNHVSGYRVETWIFGELGQIHVGRFEQRHHEVTVEAYGRRHLIAKRTFPMPVYEGQVPEFFDRFGPAYRAELAEFVACCRAGAPFSVTHRDGVAAMEAIDAGRRGLIAGGERVAAR